MHPIKIQVCVVLSAEIDFLRLLNAKLQQNYEELSRLLDGLRMMYSDQLAYGRLKRSLDRQYSPS